MIRGHRRTKIIIDFRSPTKDYILPKYQQRYHFQEILPEWRRINLKNSTLYKKIYYFRYVNNVNKLFLFTLRFFSYLEQVKS